MDGNTLLTTREVGLLVGFSTKTIQTWCQNGDLKHSKLPSGHRRIKLADLTKFAKDHNLNVDLKTQLKP